MGGRRQGHEEFLQDIPLDGGVDLRSHEFRVESPSMLVSENTQFEVQGTVKKRPARGDNTDVGASGDSVISMAKRGREVLMLTSDGPYILEDIDGTTDEITAENSNSSGDRRNVYMPLDIESWDVWSSPDSQGSIIDSAVAVLKVSGRIGVLMGRDNAGTDETWLYIFDASSMSLLTETRVKSGDGVSNQACLIQSGAEDFRIVYMGSSNAVKTVAYDVSGGGLGGTTTLWTAAATSGLGRVSAVYDSGTSYWVTGPDSAAATSIRVSRYTGTTEDDNITHAAGATTSAHSICILTTDTVVVTYALGSTAVEAGVYAWGGSTISETFGGQQVFGAPASGGTWRTTVCCPMTTARVGSNHFFVAADSDGSSVPAVETAILRGDSATSPSSTNEATSLCITSRPIAVGGVPYVVLQRKHGSYGSEVLDPVSLLVSCYSSSATTHGLSINGAIGRDWVALEDDTHRGQCNALVADPDDSSAFYFGLVGEPAVVSDWDGVDGTSVRVLRADAAPKPVPFTESDSKCQLYSGQIADFDGLIVAESNPAWTPDQLAPQSGGSGPNLSAGDYSFRAVYVWRDSEGVLHRSAPSNAQTFTANGSTAPILYVEKLSVTAWDGVSHPSYGIEIYATDTDGTTYYLLNDGSGDLVRPTGSGTGVQHGYWEFNTIPQPATTEAALYTDGGELAPDPPPATIGGVIVKDRSFALAAEDRELVWASKPKQEGIAWEWSAGQVYRFPGGDNTAIGEVNDLPIVFKRDSVWTMYGEGPDSNGVGAFALPTRIASVGCVNRATLVRTPIGLIFQSERGFYVLDNSLQARPIGVPVDDIVTTGYTGAMLNEKASEVIFVCPSSEGDWLVYNYLLDKWSSWTGEDAACCLSRESISDRGGSAIDHGLLWCSTATTPQLYELSDTPNNDQIILETPWFKPGGIQGNVRFRELFFESKYLASHSIRMQVYFDFEDTASMDEEWDATAITNSTTNNHTNLRLSLDSTVHKAIKVRIEEQSSTAEAVRPTGLSISYLLERGPYRRLRSAADSSADTAG